MKAAVARVGAYPGSFDPPTLAHLEVAEQARRVAGLARVDLVISEVALGKPAGNVTTLEDRCAVLESIVATRPGLGWRRTAAQLLADIAAGYDAVIVGADKWQQVIDPSWYPSRAARDRAVEALPLVVAAPRPPAPMPSPVPGRLVVLDLASVYQAMSSSAVRAGQWLWMAPEARDFDQRTGAWSDPARYRAASHHPPDAAR